MSDRENRYAIAEVSDGVCRCLEGWMVLIVPSWGVEQPGDFQAAPTNVPGELRIGNVLAPLFVPAWISGRPLWVEECSGRTPMEIEMKRIWRDNGLSLVLFALFLLFWAGQALTGWLDETRDRRDHGAPPPTFVQYLGSGSFVEATAENWESEFLQMFAYVLFTVFLYQRGSAESKSPDEPEDVDRDPRLSRGSDAPGPVKAGGWRLRLYEHSLSLAFLALFLVSFVSHALGGLASFNEEQRLHGQPESTLWEFLAHSRFWFQSFQNWQSEFLAIWFMVVLTIFLRQRGSPESKPVDSPHDQTGA